ncbi:MAG: PASTA domain-containing protein [Elusimicrobiota bacterium]
MHIKITRKNVIIGIVGLIAAYFLVNWVLSGIIHSRNEVMVPDLKAKSLAEAVSLLSPLNLGIKKEDEQFDKNYPAGTVVRQNPQPGITVREGKIVRVTISQGGETIFVPDLTGQQARTAEINIRSLGLSLGEESTRHSLVIDKGSVVSQDPSAGTIVDKESLVNLVISAGTPPDNMILTPNFIGKNSGEAKKWAEEKGVQLDVAEEPAAGVASGTIIRQDPAADTDITTSKQVRIAAATETGAVPFRGRTFYYEIPQGGGDRELRLVLLDDGGEKEIFKGIKAPGTKLELPIDPKGGDARIRIFINNILVEEREIN